MFTTKTCERCGTIGRNPTRIACDACRHVPDYEPPLGMQGVTTFRHNGRVVEIDSEESTECPRCGAWTQRPATVFHGCEHCQDPRDPSDLYKAQRDEPRGHAPDPGTVDPDIDW